MTLSGLFPIPDRILARFNRSCDEACLSALSVEEHFLDCESEGTYRLDLRVHLVRLATIFPASLVAMDVAFSMPDRLAERLQERWGNLPERALEAVVADAYREGVLTLGEVREILGHSTRLGTEAFLKERGALLTYGEEELEEDVEAARKAQI